MERHLDDRPTCLQVACEACTHIEEDDIVFAFTLNPNPRWFNSNDVEKQYEQLFMLLLSKAPKVFDKFVFTPEMTLQGNIHIHGWYTVKDPIKYFKFFLPKAKNIGFVKIKKDNITEEWYDYLEKDMEIMEDIMTMLPVPYTHLDKIDYLKRWNDKKKIDAYRRYTAKKKKGNVRKDITCYFLPDDISDDE